MVSVRNPLTRKKIRKGERAPGALARTFATGVIFCLVLIAVAACGSTNGDKKRRDYKSTTARPEPVHVAVTPAKPKWIEPKEPVKRSSLKLGRGTTARLLVAADTFEGAGIVPALRDELVKALQEESVFKEINVLGTQGHIALNVVLVDMRDSKILFGTLKGKPRLKVRLTVVNTQTKRRLSPGDPKNLFYGNVKEVSDKIAEYISG